MGYIMPSCGFDLPIQKIVIGIGMGLTIYKYGKLIIKLYRFNQQLLYKRKQLKKRK